MTTMTTDNMKEILRPVLLDAAESISSARNDQAVEIVTDYIETATVEELQFTIMGAVQDALVQRLGIEEQD